MKSNPSLIEDYKSKAQLQSENNLLKSIIYNLLEQTETEGIEFSLNYQGPDCLMHIKVDGKRVKIVKPPYVAKPPQQPEINAEIQEVQS